MLCTLVTGRLGSGREGSDGSEDGWRIVYLWSKGSLVVRITVIHSGQSPYLITHCSTVSVIDTPPHSLAFFTVQALSSPAGKTNLAGFFCKVAQKHGRKAPSVDF